MTLRRCAAIVLLTLSLLAPSAMFAQTQSVQVSAPDPNELIGEES
jgi:hypothetical protein